MRADKNDIIEIFGYKPDDKGPKATKAWKECTCPFLNKLCTKKNHKDDVFSGVCTVSYGSKKGGDQDTVICPARLYAQDYLVIKNAARDIWKGIDVIIGGTLDELLERARKVPEGTEVAIAFGQGSGKEVSIRSDTKLSFDWIVQRFKRKGRTLIPLNFIVVEVQSTDTVNSYRDTWNDYRKWREGKKVDIIVNSSHTINSANVHKRIIPQLIRKGNVCLNSKNCSGFYFIVPEIIFQKFEATINIVENSKTASNKNVSVMTYSLEMESSAQDHTRKLIHIRTCHIDLAAFALSFITYRPANSENILEKKLDDLLRDKIIA